MDLDLDMDLKFQSDGFVLGFIFIKWIWIWILFYMDLYLDSENFMEMYLDLNFMGLDFVHGFRHVSTWT